nr:zinc finger, CCHC-type [Tanacetum cinerariifolium]
MCLKDHLDAKERKLDKCPLEIPLDFEEDVFDDDVQRNEAIPLSDEKFALDASSEGTLSPRGPRKRAKWDNDDYVCRGLILNGMSDFLLDIYQNVNTSKELWDTLEDKYMAENASSKKFLVSNFTNYKMADSRPVLKQYNKLLGILGRVQDNDKPKGNNIAGSSVVNMVEHNNSYRYNDNIGKRKHHDTKADPNKKPKVTCWKCGKPKNLKKDCKADRCWFKTYESLNDGSILYMGNESTTLVHGRGCVDLRLNIVYDNIGSAFVSTSKLNDSILWHARLSHVHFKRMQDMSKDGLIPSFDMDTEKFVRLPDPKLKTLGERGIECIFVGYAEHSKAFRFYVIEPNNSVAINSIIESKDAIFDDNRFSSVPRPSQRSLVKETEDSGGSVVPKKVTEKEAINDEMNSIIGNNTWVLTDLPPGYKPIGCKWIFKRKLKMDVKTTFLNGELDEEVYMNQPQGFIMPGNENNVCKLIKSFYELKQVDMTKEFLSSRFSMKDSFLRTP